MSLEDPHRPRRLRKAIAVAMLASGLVGALVFGANWLIMADRWNYDRFCNGMFYAFNTTAVAFWFLFLLLYFTQVRLSPAALDWERRLRVAEEVFKREKAQGRGSWWM